MFGEQTLIVGHRELCGIDGPFFSLCPQKSKSYHQTKKHNKIVFLKSSVVLNLFLNEIYQKKSCLVWLIKIVLKKLFSCNREFFLKKLFYLENYKKFCGFFFIYLKLKSLFYLITRFYI